MKYIVASRHTVDLADGRMVEPGEQIDKLNAKDPHNAALIADGTLLPVESKPTSAKKTTTNKEDGK